MGLYTILNNAELDSRIDRDLNICKEHILKAFDDRILSIVLIGGYGRGEGGAVMRGNSYFPRNNYDILIVFKKIGFLQRENIRKLLDRIKATLDAELMTVFEYSFQARNKLANARNIMIYQDMYNAGKTIYGSDIRSILPSRVALPLDNSEALKVIRNRATSLLFIKTGKSRKGYDITQEQTKTWYSKAVIGFGDAVLIVAKKYKTRYAEKMIMIEGLSSREAFVDGESLNYFKALHKAASLYRLKNEDDPVLSDEDKISNSLSRINLWVLKKYLNTPELTWRDVAGISICADRSFLRSARNVYVNMREYGPYRFLAMFLHKPAAIFTHPSEKLFTVLPLVLYKHDFDSLPACVLGLNMDKRATIADVRNECIRIFEKYIA